MTPDARNGKTSTDQREGLLVKKSSPIWVEIFWRQIYYIVYNHKHKVPSYVQQATLRKRKGGRHCPPHL